jgi:predicted transcriptional regulator
MMLKIQLVKDDKVILEIPLSPTNWVREELEDEFEAAERNFYRTSKIFDAFANETRLRMMRALMEQEDYTLSFAEFMKDLDLNPKLVWENARKLSEGGLLRKTGRGKYKCSEFGQRTFMMMNLALRHLQDMLEELEEF